MMRSCTPGIAALLCFCSPSVFAQSAEPAAFIVNNVSDEITSFTMNADGTMNFIGTYASSDGPQSAALTSDGRYLAIGHGTMSDTVEALYVYEVNADTSLSLVHQTTVPDSPLDMIWLNDDVLAVTKTLLSSGNEVRTYQWDPLTPSLDFVAFGATGSLNVSLAIHPELPVLYAQDSTGNAVRWFTFQTDGTLGSPGMVQAGGYFPLNLGMMKGGDHLFAGGGVSGGGHIVIEFDVDETGALTLHPDSPFTSPGESPAYTVVSNDDAFLFVGHGSDATVHSFAIERDGSIAPTGFSFDVGLQGTIGDIEVLGEYLLVTDESTALDGITGLYSFDINENGSFTTVDGIYSTDGVRPEKIVAWTPHPTGDIDSDGDVDFTDLLLLLDLWDHKFSEADLDGSGIVGFADLLILLANWT